MAIEFVDVALDLSHAKSDPKAAGARSRWAEAREQSRPAPVAPGTREASLEPYSIVVEDPSRKPVEVVDVAAPDPVGLGAVQLSASCISRSMAASRSVAR